MSFHLFLDDHVRSLYDLPFEKSNHSKDYSIKLELLHCFFPPLSFINFISVSVGNGARVKHNLFRCFASKRPECIWTFYIGFSEELLLVWYLVIDELKAGREQHTLFLASSEWQRKPIMFVNMGWFIFWVLHINRNITGVGVCATEILYFGYSQ